jgi:hypothetical protein
MLIPKQQLLAFVWWLVVVSLVMTPGLQRKAVSFDPCVRHLR